MRQDRSVGGSVLALDGECFYAGLGAFAPSRLEYVIPEDAIRFEAQVGIDDEDRRGEVSFQVELDGIEVWSSGPIAGASGSRTCQIDLGQASVLSLAVTPLDATHTAHVDWAEASFVFPEGIDPPLDAGMDSLWILKGDRRYEGGALKTIQSPTGHILGTVLLRP